MLAEISIELEEIDKKVRGIDVTHCDKRDVMHIADRLQELCTRCYDALDGK